MSVLCGIFLLLWVFYASLFFISNELTPSLTSYALYFWKTIIRMEASFRKVRTGVSQMNEYLVDAFSASLLLMFAGQ